jgi:hypothetical protein
MSTPVTLQRESLLPLPLLLLLLLLLLQVFLNMQDRLLSQRGRGAWAQAYYMPTPSDSAVVTGCYLA